VLVAPGQKVGLRERKKRQTRERIVEVARALFATRGYEPTSISDIADGADIAVSTVFGYFPNKAEIFFAGYDEIVDDFVQSLEARDPGVSAILATVQWHEKMRALIDAQPADSPGAHWRHHSRRLADEDPVLNAMERERYARAESVLARAVAEDLGDEPADLRPQLIAAVKVALMFTLSRHAPGEAAQPGGDLGSYVDECLRAAAAAIERVPLPGTALGDAQNVA
jgi:AcrR family transcriptional regulator